MKRISYLIAATLCLLMASLCACSSGNDDMYQYAASDNMVILSLSPEQIIKNAGFTNGPDGLQAPEGFDRLTGNNESLNTLLKIKGIDTSTILFTADVANNGLADPLMVARVTNKGDVTKFLESEQYTKASEADGYDIYDVKGSALMLSDELLVMLESTSVDECAAKLTEIKNKAAQQPLKDWQKDVLNGDETVRLITKTSKIQMMNSGFDLKDVFNKINEKMYDVNTSEMYSVVTAKLKGNTLEGESKLCDADGKDLKIKVEVPKLDTSLLKYCHAGDQVIFMTSASSIIDWRDLLAEVLGNMPQATIAANVLADIDGTVMVSGGISSISELSTSGKGFQVTIAAQFKDAKKYAEQIEMITKGQTTTYGDVKTVRIPGMPEISYTVKGKTIIASVGAPLTDEGAKVFKGTDFSGKINVFDLRLPANDGNVTFTPLPFGPNLSVVSDTKNCEFKLKLDGSDTPLLEQLIKFASTL